MIDFNRKEDIVGIKHKVLGILNMVLEDDLYNKEMMKSDLINLVAYLDELDYKVQPIEPKFIE